MKPDQVFGLLLILLAIYLGVTASDGQDVQIDLFNGDTDFDLSDLGDGDGDGDADADPPASGDGDGDGQADGDGDGQADSDGDGQADGAKAGETADTDAVDIDDFCAGAPSDSRFVDLGETHAQDIRCMEYLGIVMGVSATTYVPYDAVTRGQAASMIARMIGEANRLEAEGATLRSLPESADARFEDVAPTSPHAEAIARLNEAGIVQGFVDARYEPTGTVTRAQMASMLDRTHRYLTDDALPANVNAFSDDDDSVHHESINALADADIAVGVTDSRYEPNEDVLRGQMASLLARMMGHLEQAGRIRPIA
jgi:hypothetical protein